MMTSSLIIIILKLTKSQSKKGKNKLNQRQLKRRKLMKHKHTNILAKSQTKEFYSLKLNNLSKMVVQRFIVEKMKVKIMVVFL